MEIQQHRLKNVAYESLSGHGTLVGPKFIVIHYTAGGSASGSINAMRTAGVSAHLVVERDGTVIQCVDFNHVAWHAGRSHWRNHTGLNRYSVGVEVCNYGWLPRRADGTFQRTGSDGPTPSFSAGQVIVADHKNGRFQNMGWEIYPYQQLKAVREACQAIIGEYPSVMEIVGHDDISPDRKQDPGPAMPMDSLQVLLAEKDNAAADAPRYEVIARYGLNMRAGPGVEFDVLSVLLRGMKVFVPDDSATWFPIDLENDGSIDGFVHSGYLRMV